jgi:hypothetical protein
MEPLFAESECIVAEYGERFSSLEHSTPHIWTRRFGPQEKGEKDSFSKGVARKVDDQD